MLALTPPPLARQVLAAMCLLGFTLRFAAGSIAAVLECHRGRCTSSFSSWGSSDGGGVTGSGADIWGLSAAPLGGTRPPDCGLPMLWLLRWVARRCLPPGALPFPPEVLRFSRGNGAAFLPGALLMGVAQSLPARAAGLPPAAVTLLGAAQAVPASLLLPPWPATGGGVLGFAAVAVLTVGGPLALDMYARHVVVTKRARGSTSGGGSCASRGSAHGRDRRQQQERPSSKDH
jgi:hypothetical protein